MQNTDKKRDREMLKKIRERLMERIEDKQVFQVRPNTCVVFKARYNNKTYNLTGFSKVCWPDPFDPNYGVELAIGKAVARLAREIYDRQYAKPAG